MKNLFNVNIDINKDDFEALISNLSRRLVMLGGFLEPGHTKTWYKTVHKNIALANIKLDMLIKSEVL